MTDQYAHRDDGADVPWRALATAPVLLWTGTHDGRCTYVSYQWRDYTGRSLAEEIGNGWWGAIHPDDRKRRQAAFAEAATDPEPFEVEYRLRRSDGTWRWLLERGAPLPVSAGGGLVGACLDVTDRHRHERELLRSREELRLALAAGNMGTWVWDRRTGRVSRDTNLQALYGLDAVPAAGNFDEWVGLVHPEDRSRVLEEVDRALTVGGTYHLEHRIVRPDGTVRWLERRGEAYLDDTGAVAGTRGLVIDVTDRKNAEQERNRLLVAEQEARWAAEVAARRVANLQAVTAGLAEARTAEEVAEVIVVQAAEGLGAASAALCLLDDDGDLLEVIRHVGYDPSSIDRFQSFSIDADLPASHALRTGELVLLHSLEERDERYPVLRGVPARNASFAVVPLFVNREPAGAIALGWAAEREFDEDDRRFLTALGQQAAQALDRAQFYEAELWRHERQGFLAEASRLLGSSLDYHATLARVAQLAVPAAGDSCSVHLLEDDDLRTVASFHAEPPPDEVLADGPHWCLAATQLLDVLRRGESLLLPKVDAELRRGWAEDEAHAMLMDRVGSRSILAVPLWSPEQAVGVLVLAMGGSGRRYTSDDVPFVEDLAARAASAVVNGRAHQARTAIAQTLQQSLLPPEVPLLPGLEVAAWYRPVGHDGEVGGDFYDVFAAGDGRWGVVIGDVSGKGVPAASLTALARHTVRTAARRENKPSGVLEALNNSILDDGVGERFCTVALAFLDHDDDGVGITLSCGGQPLPLLVRPDGDVRPVGEPGTAIGLFGGPHLCDTAQRLEPGELLVLFTDGVVEARSPDGTFADGLLESTLAAHAGHPAEAVARGVEAALLEFAGGRPRDDTAILVLRRPPDIFHAHLAPTPLAVPRTRKALRSWLAERLPEEHSLLEDVLLVANELATNAARAARSALDLHVYVDADRVTVDVSDDGPGLGESIPPLVEPAPDALAGRGLHIVGHLADDAVVRSGSCGTLVRCVRRRQPPPA